MKLIGTIAKLQIQLEPLKSGEGANRVYSSEKVQTVNSLRLTHRGVFGQEGNGSETMDVHHIDHPRTRNRGNENGISVGFLSNYDRMRDRFGGHVEDGMGGENILVQPVEEFSMDAIDTHLYVELTADKTLIKLENIIATPPCEPFSRFISQRQLKGTELKDTLQYLSDGTRGFYATLCFEEKTEPVIRPGDRVFSVAD